MTFSFFNKLTTYSISDVRAVNIFSQDGISKGEVHRRDFQEDIGGKREGEEEVEEAGNTQKPVPLWSLRTHRGLRSLFRSSAPQ